MCVGGCVCSDHRLIANPVSRLLGMAVATAQRATINSSNACVAEMAYLRTPRWGDFDDVCVEGVVVAASSPLVEHAASPPPYEPLAVYVFRRRGPILVSSLRKLCSTPHA